MIKRAVTSAAAAVLALVLLACPLLGLISGRLCRWCCLRVSLRLSPLWGWCFVRSGAVWACPGVPVSSAAALVGLALGDDAGQKDMA